MAAERDEAGSPGTGLSGTGRDHSGLEAGTTRSMAMGDAPGSADVHAGIAFNANAGTDEGVRDRTVNRVKDAAGTVADAAGSLGQRARSVAGDVADRAGDVASQARDRLGALAEGARSTLEERGWLERLRENPLPALGVAFAAGFLLAGGSGGTEVATGTTTGGARGLKGSAGRIRGELRGALAAGLSAGLAQGARAFLRNIGAEDGVINSVIENLPGMGGGQQGGGGYGSTQRPRSATRPMASSGSRAGGQSSYGGGSSQGGTTTRHREPSHRETF